MQATGKQNRVESPTLQLRDLKGGVEFDPIFAAAYADETDRDYEALAKAAKQKRIRVANPA